jgi:lysophospholipase L1-like esterase
VRTLSRVIAALRRFVLAGVVTLVAAELSLQAAAWVIHRTGRGGAVGWRTSDLRVLCLGDSNTYGIWVQKDEAWPAVLQAHWNAATPDRKIEVINLAFPGTTSSRVLKNLPAVLDTFRPDLVLVMVGVNDWWSPPVAEGTRDAGLRLKAWLYEHVRLYRIVYMLQRQAFDPAKLHVNDSIRQGDLAPENQPDVVERVKALRAEMGRRIQAGESLEGLRKEVPESLQAPFEYEGKRFDLGMSVEGNDSGEKPADTLERSLVGIGRLARTSSGQLLVMTYPSNVFVYAAANRVVRGVTQRLDVRMLDLTPRFLQACATPTTKGCDRYFLSDQHPNAAGHVMVADAIAEQLRSMMQR